MVDIVPKSPKGFGRAKLVVGPMGRRRYEARHMTRPGVYVVLSIGGDDAHQ